MEYWSTPISQVTRIPWLLTSHHSDARRACEQATSDEMCIPRVKHLLHDENLFVASLLWALFLSKFCKYIVLQRRPQDSELTRCFSLIKIFVLSPYVRSGARSFVESCSADSNRLRQTYLAYRYVAFLSDLPPHPVPIAEAKSVLKRGFTKMWMDDS